MANSVDRDPTPSASAASDLGRHYLFRPACPKKLGKYGIFYMCDSCVTDLPSFLVLYNSEPGNSISYKIISPPREDSDQPAHPRSLIRDFAGHFVGNQGSTVSSGEQRRLWSACANAQAVLSLRSAHMRSCWKCCFPARISLYLLSYGIKILHSAFKYQMSQDIIYTFIR